METVFELEHMRLEKSGKLAWITFTRERYLNAMNNDAVAQLHRLASYLAEDVDVRVIVIRGRGRAFCTGIDLKELAAEQIDMSYHHRWEGALRLFETMEKIVVTGMHGYCLGGALQLALAGDIRVSTPDCRIGLPAIKESLIPGLSTFRLPRYIGLGRAKKMILGGENVDGTEALRIGLVDHLADADDFFTHLDGIAHTYLAACSAATRYSKLLINQAFDLDFETFQDEYFAFQERAHAGPDAAEASRAYLAKRDPSWQ